MAIVVLILWVATAGAGVTLLGAGGAARRVAVSPAHEPVPAAAANGRIGAIPLTDDGRPPPGPHTRVATPAGEHPLLEFSHPALAVTGIACWTMFTFVHYRPLAWIAFGVLLATLMMGLGWFASNRRAAIRQASGAWLFPGRLVITHGALATCSLALTVLTALTASHG